MSAKEVDQTIVTPINGRADAYCVQVGEDRRAFIRITDATVWPPNNYGAGPFVEYMSTQGATLFNGARVLDVGSGSGVLGLAAGLLGAAEVYAVEMNPIAVAHTRENWAANGLDPNKLHAYERNGIRGFADEVGKGLFDVILANLPTLPLVTEEVTDLQHRRSASEWNMNPSASARHLVDEVLCEGARLLGSKGTVLFLQGSTQDLSLTLERLREEGWTSWEIVHQHQQPIGENYAHYIDTLPGWEVGNGIQLLPVPLATGETHYRTLYVIKATR